MTTIGIDPGQSGGIAWIDSNGIACAKMPETERGYGM
jgi:predicted RNase H-like nuclease (RuvC/YqgF family)